MANAVFATSAARRVSRREIYCLSVNIRRGPAIAFCARFARRITTESPFCTAETLLLAAAFLALGLAVGFFTHDRAQALIGGITAWLILLFGIDLIALFAARWEFVQKVPDVWSALLMLNPLDAFRIEALFALEQIPTEAASKTPLSSWWIAHAGWWFAFVALAWAVVCIVLTGRRLNRWEE